MGTTALAVSAWREASVVAVDPLPRSSSCRDSGTSLSGMLGKRTGAPRGGVVRRRPLMEPSRLEEGREARPPCL